MKHRVLGALCLAALPLAAAWAQLGPNPDKAAMDAERQHIASERQQVEQRFSQAQSACYRKFAVQDCLNEVRRERRRAVDGLHKREAALHDIERQRRGTAATERLEEKPRRAEKAEDQRERAREQQQERDERAAGHARSRAEAQAREQQNRQGFERKQRVNAERQARAARKRADEAAERERYQHKLDRAAGHDSSRAHKQAERTKPRAAPLPPPPP